MLSASQSIRDIAARQPSAVAVFERFEIDLCSSADKSLEEACSELYLSLEQVLEKLDECPTSCSSLVDPFALSLAHLIQHIVRVHHQCVRQGLPSLARLAHGVIEECGDQAPELKKVEELIERLHAEMLENIRKEEQVLFPFIVQMEESSVTAYPPAHACFRTVSHPVFMMVQEHESANSIMKEIRRCTGDFAAPESACPGRIALLDGLLEFEKNLREHIHLENDVLFPRSIQMEAELQKRT